MKLVGGVGGEADLHGDTPATAMPPAARMAVVRRPAVFHAGYDASIDMQSAYTASGASRRRYGNARA